MKRRLRILSCLVLTTMWLSNSYAAASKNRCAAVFHAVFSATLKENLVVASHKTYPNKNTALPRSAEFMAEWFDKDHYILTPTDAMSGPNSSFSFADYALRKFPTYFAQFEIRRDEKKRLIVPTVARLNSIIEAMNDSGHLGAPKIRYYENTGAAETPFKVYVTGLTHAPAKLPVALFAHTTSDGSLFIHDIIVHTIGYFNLTELQVQNVRNTFQFLTALKKNPLLSKDPLINRALNRAMAQATQKLDIGTGSISNAFMNNPKDFASGQALVNELNVLVVAPTIRIAIFGATDRTKANLRKMAEFDLISEKFQKSAPSPATAFDANWLKRREQEIAQLLK